MTVDKDRVGEVRQVEAVERGQVQRDRQPRAEQPPGGPAAQPRMCRAEDQEAGAVVGGGAQQQGAGRAENQQRRDCHHQGELLEHEHREQRVPVPLDSEPGDRGEGDAAEQEADRAPHRPPTPQRPQPHRAGQVGDGEHACHYWQQRQRQRPRAEEAEQCRRCPGDPVVHGLISVEC